MTERKYRDDEVREIFGLATSGRLPDAPARPAGEGLTLQEIQSIGREVGIEPDLVERAASALDARPPRPMRKSLGMPIEVGRSVLLPRPLSDGEWDRLVAELRETFGARGRIAGTGNLREWSNGNLHACVEPTADGAYRLRLGTLKGDAAGVNALGATGVVASVVVFASLAVSGELAQGFMVPWTLGAAGVGAFLANMVRLPRWARQREEQMDRIALTVRSMMGENER